MNKTIVLSSLYLAPIEYYALLYQKQNVTIDLHEFYVKQTFRNRALILDSTGILPLTIPVDKSAKRGTKMKDVLISDQTNWQHIHWNALISAYNSTPFFQYYMDDIKPIYHRQYKYLIDISLDLNSILLDALDIEVDNIKYSDEYVEIEDKRIKDYRGLLNPKNEEYLNTHFSIPSYYQLFDRSQNDKSSLSIVDLLFNMGNESSIILAKTKIGNE